VIAAFLLGIFGITNMVPLLAIDGITFLMGIIPLFLITIPRDHIKIYKKKTETSFRAEFMEGITAIREGTGMITLLLSFTMTNFFLSSSMTFLPLIVHSPTGLAGNEFILALGLSGVQAGNLIASSMLLKLQISTGLVRKVTIGILGGFMGLLIAGSGVLLQLEYVFVLGLLLLGLMIPIAAISSSVIWQTYYPTELQGRIFTVRSTVSSFTTPLAILSIGFVTEYLPHTLRYLLLAFGAIGFVLYLLAYNFTKIKDIDQQLEEQHVIKTPSEGEIRRREPIPA
jgi:hypothetical protein